VRVGIVCRASLSSLETWPSGPVIQTSRGRTRKQFWEVLVVSLVAYYATCRKLIYVVSLMIEDRLASALKIKILCRKQMPNHPNRQRDIWLNKGDDSQRGLWNSNWTFQQRSHYRRLSCNCPKSFSFHISETMTHMYPTDNNNCESKICIIQSNAVRQGALTLIFQATERLLFLEIQFGESKKFLIKTTFSLNCQNHSILSLLTMTTYQTRTQYVRTQHFRNMRLFEL
jgi:hypothetical protein